MKLNLFRLLSGLIPLVALLTVVRAAAPALGPFPPEVTAWTNAIKEQQRQAGQSVLAQIAEAAAKGEKEVRLTKGDYRFNETKGAHITLSKVHDLTIDFQGSTLWFESEITGIWLSGCRNVTLKNVFLDWDPLPFFQGQVTAVSAKDDTFDFRIDPGYERVSAEMNDPMLKNNWRGLVFANGELKKGQQGFRVEFSWDHRNADGTYHVKFWGFHGVSVAAGGVAVGDSMVILARMGRAIKLDGSDDCTLEDVTLYSSPFVAFVGNMANGTVLRRCHILRRPGTNRLLAGNADGINFANAQRGPLIEDCTMETIGDDFVNIHGFYARVLAQENPSQVICSRIAYQGDWSKPKTVEFFDRATMTPLGTRRVTAQALSWKIERDHCLADLSHKWHSGEASGLDYGKTVPAQRLTLDAPLPITGDVILSCDSFSGPGTIVRNCDFKGSLARGILLQTHHALVENNRIAVIAGSAVAMVGQGGFWGEGTYPYSVVIRGNTFSDTCIFGGATGTIFIQEGDNFQAHHLPHDIQIINNVFVRTGGTAIIARGVDRLTITGNHISDYDNLPPVPPLPGRPAEERGTAIRLESCDDVILNDNQIKQPGAYAEGDAISTSNTTLKK